MCSWRASTRVSLWQLIWRTPCWRSYNTLFPCVGRHPLVALVCHSCYSMSWLVFLLFSKLASPETRSEVHNDGSHSGLCRAPLLLTTTTTTTTTAAATTTTTTTVSPLLKSSAFACFAHHGENRSGSSVVGPHGDKPHAHAGCSGDCFSQACASVARATPWRGPGLVEAEARGR